MFELVPSHFMKDYFSEVGFEFSDFQKATLIWNALGKTRSEITAALEELAATTDCEITKRQIRERLEFEKKKYDVFRDNSSARYVYVIEDRACRRSFGYFAEYEKALKYALKYSDEHKTECSVNKQLIVKTEESFKRREETAGLSVYEGETDGFHLCGGEPVSGVSLDRRGRIQRIWSCELPEEEESAVNESREDRFEHPFIKIPFQMEIGAPAKNIISGAYRIFTQRKAEWDECMRHIGDRKLRVDFSDVQVIVYELADCGGLPCQQISPILPAAGFSAAENRERKLH